MASQLASSNSVVTSPTIVTPTTPGLLTSRDLLLLPQTSPTTPVRVTSNHMSSGLCERLIQLCNQHQVIITDNGNSMESRMKRRSTWMEIARHLNSEFNVDFTADQYKKKYQNLKTALKSKIMNLRTSPESGGGAMVSSVALRERIAAAVASTAAAAAARDAARERVEQLLEVKNEQQMTGSNNGTTSAFSEYENKAAATGEVNITGELDVQQLLASSLLASVDRPLSVLAGDSTASSLPTETTSSNSATTTTATLTPHVSAPEDPTRLFCLSLAEPLRRVQAEDPVRYVRLKKAISELVLNAELDATCQMAMDDSEPIEEDVP